MRKTLSLALASSFNLSSFILTCAAAARSRRAQLALCRRHALDRTGKQSWHAAAEPYTPHGNGLDETSTAAMEAVLRHRKPEKISPPEAPWVYKTLT